MGICTFLTSLEGNLEILVIVSVLWQNVINVTGIIFVFTHCARLYMTKKSYLLYVIALFFLVLGY